MHSVVVSELENRHKIHISVSEFNLQKVFANLQNNCCHYRYSIAPALNGACTNAVLERKYILDSSSQIEFIHGNEMKERKRLVNNLNRKQSLYSMNTLYKHIFRANWYWIETDDTGQCFDSCFKWLFHNGKHCHKGGSVSTKDSWKIFSNPYRP